MAELNYEYTSQDCDLLIEDDALDDFAPTRIASDRRGALAVASERNVRPGQVRVGDLLAGKYRVERVHRRGALGVTVEAMHTQLGQRVAVRLLLADPRAYPEAATRFLRGARMAVQFQNEHTSRIIDVGTLESGAPYVVAEFLPGSDLRRILRVREWLPVPEAVDYVLQACEALSEAHGHNVVHRNLKPSNLFLTRRDGARRLVVLDFGVSEDPLSDAAINLGGTSGASRGLAYLAPEQVREPDSVDARADIWALGAILHEMLTGCVLFDAQTTPGLLAMISADAPVPVSHLRPEIPAELESAVLRCLAKERDERYGTIAELAAALRPFASAAGLDSVERVSRNLGRHARSTRPPPLPGQPTRAIVHVARPPAKQVAAQPPVAESRMSRRLAELVLTGAALAAAGALGVFVAIHTMERALTAAMTPRSVVASLSPALTTPIPDSVQPPLPVAASVTLPRVLSAPVIKARPASAPVAAAAPSAPALPNVLPQPAVEPSSPRRASAPRSLASERAVVADAKPMAAKGAPAPGLFDDAN